MSLPGNTLLDLIKHAEPFLLSITEERASAPLAPGKWCPKEVLGHLLDSANNNLARFIRLRSVDHLFFDGYAQEEWVRAQDHARANWSELVQLWASYNRHIARVMDLVPPAVALKPRSEHRPLGSTYAPLPADGIPTLDWLMRDYVEHMRHHLRQVDARLIE